MTSLLADTGSAASKKVELSAVITKKTETTNAAGQKNTTVHEIRTDVETTIGSVGGTATDGDVLSESDASATTCPADDASSDAETGSSSTSDSSEHPHLSEEHDAPEASIVQHFERTERTITNTEFPIESFELERGMEDEADVMAIDIQQIFHDMLQAGLQPRGANNKKQAPAVAKVPDPMRAAREKQIADKAKEEAARKVAKEKEAKEKAAREKAAKRAK